MNIEALRKVHQERPFQPFDLHIADGRIIHVPHPEFLAVFRGGRSIIVTHENCSWDLIDLLLVTSIHVNNGQSTKA